MAEQLARKIAVEKNALAKRVEELRKELEVTRLPHLQGSCADSGDESNTSENFNSGVCDMVSFFAQALTTSL